MAGSDDKRNPQQSSLTLFVFLIVFLICAAGSAVLVASQRSAIDAFLARFRTVETSSHAKAPAPGAGEKVARIGKRPLLLTDRLGDPTVVFPDADFSLADVFSATDFCAALGAALPDLKLSWARNAFVADTTDCSGGFDAAEQADDAVHNSFFTQSRRDARGGSSVVRLKLVYLPERLEENYKPAFEKAAEALFKPLFGVAPADFMENIRALRPFKVEDRGVTVQFFEETLFVGAFNLIISARCPKFHCQSASRQYKLNLLVPDAGDSDQQE